MSAEHEEREIGVYNVSPTRNIHRAYIGRLWPITSGFNR
jgi:hypothetical protein